MDIALCYENVLPERGGCETYIADLARRLAADGHQLHLYASLWDASALPAALHYHPIPLPRGPRFMRPWRFGWACLEELRKNNHHVSIGFNKTWGQDILYPQAGLHAASAEQNLKKHGKPLKRFMARLIQGMDLAHQSYLRLERRQYFGPDRPLIIVNSAMVRRHCQQYYGMRPDRVRVLYSAIDAGRFQEDDRSCRRLEWRQRWGIASEETVGLFIAMNYQLKGLEPLLHSLAYIPAREKFRLVVAGNPRTRPYERLAHRLGVSHRVCFAGYCKETRNCYFAADFLVHPTFYDPCSLVVLEALSCGLPVITSRNNGASDLMNPPHDGYVVKDPHDHRHLAWCIEQLLDNPRRIACAQAVRREAPDWSFDRHYRLLVQWLTEAASRRMAA